LPAVIESPLYDRRFALVFAGNILFTLANALLIHFARYVTFLGGDKTDVGWIMGSSAVAAILMRPWIGRWIDQFGAKKVWAAGYLLYIAAVLGYLTVDRLGPLVYLLRAASVLAPALIFTSTLAYLAHTTSPQRLAEAIGTLGIGGFLGVGVGPLLGDLFLGSMERTWTDFAWVFGTAAAFVAGGLVLLAPLPPIGPQPDHHPAPFFDTVQRFWPGSIMAVTFLFGAYIAVPFGFLAEFADSRRIHNVGLFFVVYCAWAILMRLVFRTLMQRIGRERMLLIGMVFMSAGMASFLLADNALMLMIPALLCATAHSFTYHNMVSLAVERFPPALRGTATAMALMVLDAGTMAAGPVLGYFDYRFSFVGLAVLSLVAGGVCELARATSRKEARRTSAACAAME
jgi:MFS family permease